MNPSVISLADLISDLDKNKDDNDISRSFRMRFSFSPKKEKTIIKLGGESICSIGNVSMIIAPPGSGKSNVCEAAAAGAINPECDALGFEVDSEKTLFIDTERVLNDLYRGLKRIKKRCGSEESEIEKRLDMRSFLQIEDAAACWSEIEHLVSTNDYELVIIDGTADFVISVNDEAESKNFWRKLIALANKKEFGVLLTIHPNPGDEEGKATGHLGSQGQKKAESVFNLFKSKDDKEVREITSESAHGKVRNSKDKIKSSFKWSTESGMFVSCEVIKKKKGGFEIVDLFEEKDAYTFKEMVQTYRKITGKGVTTAKARIKDARELEEIFEQGGLYWLNNKNEEEVKRIMEGPEEEELPF